MSGVTPVGSGSPPLSLGFILPATTQGELSAQDGSTHGPTGSAVAVAELCRRAEATGADSLWAVDHLYWPHPIAEAFTTLAVAAVTTTRPMLGTCVLQLPLRPASAVAKQATALQLLSGGRFVLGLGVGIHETEYVRAGVDYHRRGRLMDEGVAGLRRAWAGPEAGGADYVQEPASVPVPLWFGGASAAARRRAAAVGDGWVPLFLAQTSTGPLWRPCGARRPRPAAIPRPCRPGSSSSRVSVTTTGRPSKERNGSPSCTACRPRPSSATWWPARPRRVPPPSAVTRRPGPGTYS